MSFWLKDARKRPVKQPNKAVLDSSAVLALILKERGGERLDSLLEDVEAGEDVEAAISSVNWCEVLSRLQRDSASMTTHELSAVLAGVELVPFGKADAELAAGYSRAHPFLSLGDRACLALAISRGAKAWTTDKNWAKASVGADVKLLR